MITEIDLEEIKKTSKIRKLIKELPEICGCPYPERLGEMFTLAYDRSLEEGSAFDRTEDDTDNPGERLYCINPLNFNPSNIQAAQIGFARLVIAEARTYFTKGYIDQIAFEKVVQANQVAERENERIDAILPYEKAVIAEYWWW